MWDSNLSVQEKLSCLEKTLGTMESLNSLPGHLQKCSSLHLLLVSFFSFFFPTQMEIPPGFAVKQRSPVPACSDRVAKWLMAIHSFGFEA